MPWALTQVRCLSPVTLWTCVMNTLADGALQGLPWPPVTSLHPPALAGEGGDLSWCLLKGGRSHPAVLHLLCTDGELGQASCRPSALLLRPARQPGKGPWEMPCAAWEPGSVSGVSLHQGFPTSGSGLHVCQEALSVPPGPCPPLLSVLFKGPARLASPCSGHQN